MKVEKTKRLVLGEGETIGHKHVLESEGDIAYQKMENSIQFTLAAMSILTHDEHDRMVFGRSKIRSYHQVEFNPMDGTVNSVFD